MPPKLDLPIHEMELKYKNGLSFRDLAKEYNCSQKAVRDHFKEHGIKSRVWERDLPVDDIVLAYSDGETQSCLANKYQCSQSTIRKHLLSRGIVLRPISEIMKGKQCCLGYKHDEAFCKKISERSKNQKWSEESRQKLSKHLKARWELPGYREAHSGENNSTKRPEVRAKISGENSPNWRGGKSFEPYCPKFNYSLKEEIREKFDRKCYLCPTLEKDNGRKLDVHHVDYDKSQGCKGQKWGLIALCHPCHNKTNHDRWYWFALLRDYWIYEYIDFFDFYF